jgi:cytochrome c oxidase cbb3-type subunit III
MSSRCRNLERARRLAVVALAAALCGACDRERRDYHGATLPETGARRELVAIDPGPDAPARDPRAREFEGIAFHVQQGQRWFHWFNCNGCHAEGGGAIGPALMDAGWRYGSSIEAIYATISDGRPNGMPSFRDRITERQIWQLAAYVRSLSGQLRHDAVPSRGESLAARSSLRTYAEQPERVETVPPPEPVR